ncbi:hypothetical protein [Shinella zoogloeoides]|uniref:Uncharacterized protein n=1 Tax=Shinella zoogloeoides TaxID=352475 RepID=A0A6N8TII2_SHIZO|nr:hypothetical protein [Shinella zoogloeoides]MXO03052.1 hypothetical protein [Shinella zoogloeoides]UEX81815.1 hypothetical protein K8M09_00405 [Shinella zoogloeoides]
MRVRNRILQLNRANRLKFGTVPLPMKDEWRLRGMRAGLLDRIAAPDIFEFVWVGSQICIDNDFIVHYPTVEEWEWEEAMTCPVPHPHVWIETAADGPDGADERIYIWDVTRDEGRGFTAAPLVFDQQNSTLSHFGTYVVVAQNEIDDLGRRGTVKVFNALTQYADDYEIDEFYEHANMLARLFRMLCHPKATVETKPVDERTNRERRRRGRETIAHQTTVRISVEALQYRGTNAIGGHASPKEHHRRAHKRRYADGRETTVRECVVNRGHGGVAPLPQHFSVD